MICRNRILLCGAVIAAMSLNSCGFLSSPGVNGSIAGPATSPVAAVAGAALPFKDITHPINASSNSIGSKVGQSSGNTFFGLAFGVDVGIRRAAKNAGITRIATVDFHQSDFLGIIQAYTCTVTGE